MPNNPLPKPAAPAPKPPQAPPASTNPTNQTTPPQGGGNTSGTAPVNQQSGAVFSQNNGAAASSDAPPQSQLRPGNPPVGGGSNAAGSPPSSSASPNNMPGGRPSVQVARPGSPLPTHPHQLGQAGAQAGSTSPSPVAPGAPGTSGAPQAQPGTPQQPPTTLTALQSMSSPNLPSAGEEAKKSAPKSTSAPGYGAPPPPPGQKPNQSQQQPADDDKKSPKFAEPKKSILRFLPFIIGGVVILAALAFVGMRFLGGSNTSSVSDSSGSSSAGTNNSQGGNTTGSATTGTTSGEKVVLEYWGLWEPNEVMQEVIRQYEQDNPNVTINYTKQSHIDYRVRLRTALVQGDNSPDLFRYHASWVPMMRQELAPLPSSVMTAGEYQKTFYPVAAQMLSNSGQIVGIPLMYEGLALYYNTDIFSTAVVEPPQNWSELRDVASRLTVKTENNITRAGVALGTASNVEHFSDILAVLLKQNKADLTKPNSPETRDALLFYTNFIRSDKVWNGSLPASSVAFARGDVAMIFAPSWRAHEIKQMNPNLQFKVVPLPQLDDERVAYANFWAEGVNSKSEYKEEAWEFLKYLSTAEVQQKLYADQSEVRTFGEPYSRVDLANELADDPVVSPYLQDAPYAFSWYMSSATHDDGLNDQIIKYYEDAVNALLDGEDTEDVLQTLDAGVQQVLRQYGVTSAQ